MARVRAAPRRPGPHGYLHPAPYCSQGSRQELGRRLTHGVAIVGCGLVGHKRARALGGARLIVCADIDRARAQVLATAAGGVAATDSWEEAIGHPDVTIVIVATTNDALADITEAAIRAGHHVLVEKPAARTTGELNRPIAAAAHASVTVRVGFNHRFHPAVAKAHALVTAGAVGELMFLRGRYGHGGRLGYENEWRADPRRSGGGELIDQGVHLIDLSRWFLGELVDVQGRADTFFWPTKVDDNAFMLLRTAEGHSAWLHVSCSEWKNMFSLEIYGRTGKLQIDGLGGSYGVERLTHYRMKPEMGPPDATTWEFPGDDESWAKEFASFLDDIGAGRRGTPGLADARSALEVVDRIYQLSKSAT